MFTDHDLRIMQLQEENKALKIKLAGKESVIKVLEKDVAFYKRYQAEKYANNNGVKRMIYQRDDVDEIRDAIVDIADMLSIAGTDVFDALDERGLLKSNEYGKLDVESYGKLKGLFK